MPIKILLIEDNPDHVLVTNHILNNIDGDYQLENVREAQEGIKRINEKKYDLVLCDYRLSDKNALEILKAVKKQGKDLPFVVVTSAGSEKVAVDIMKEGAYDYIVKDASFEDVLPIVIKNSLQRYKTNKEKEKFEQQLKQYQAMVESAHDAIFFKDLESRYRIVNNKCLEVLGISRDEVIGKNDYELIPNQEEAKKSVEDDKVVFTTGKPKEITKYMTRKDGIKYWFHTIKVPQFDNKGNIIGLVGIARDITEIKKKEKALDEAYQKLKQTQEELIQSGKMAAMGQLAAGVSHELNQPLTGIKGFAQAILMDLDEENPLKEDVKKIEEQADRMDKIIRNIRLFARKSDFKMEEINVNQPIEDSLMLLNEQLRIHNIRLHKFLSNNLPNIKGDHNQLQQVFLNLLTNARDAIDKLKRETGGDIIVKSYLSEDKKYVEIIFQDTGCGISKENLRNIFNPFFTTKSPDGGVGLGLSIVYRIIENHNGKIEVESKEGKGATFRIILPIFKEIENDM